MRQNNTQTSVRKTATVRTKRDDLWTTSCSFLICCDLFNSFLFPNSPQPSSVSLPCFLYSPPSPLILPSVPLGSGRHSAASWTCRVHGLGLRLGGFHLLLLQGYCTVWRKTAWFISELLNFFVVKSNILPLVQLQSAAFQRDAFNWRITTKTFLHLFLSFFLSSFLLFFGRTVIFAGRDLVHLLFPSLFWILFLFSNLRENFESVCCLFVLLIMKKVFPVFVATEVW